MPEETIKISFEIDGAREMSRTFDTIEQRMVRFERATTAASSRGSRDRLAVVRREGTDKEREFAKLEKSVAKWEREGVSEAKKAAAEKVAIERDAAQKRAKIEEQFFQSRTRTLARNLAEETQHRERALRSEQSLRRQYSQRMAGSVSGNLAGALGRGMSLLGAGLAVGGGFSVANATRKEMGEESAITSLYNSLPNNMQGGVDRGAVRAQARLIQSQTNISSGEVVEGLHKYVAKTGDSALLQQGDDTALQIAKLAKATGSDFGALMGTAGLMKVQNRGLSNGGLLDTLRIVAAQGMTGAVEISDLAQIGGKITAPRGAFATDQTDAQRQLLGLAQVVLPTAGSPDEAATVVNRFAQDTLMKAGKPLGILDKNGNITTSVAETAGKVFDKTHGDLGKIYDLGYKRESIKMFEQLAPTYREASDAVKKAGLGDEQAHLAGRQAVVSSIESVTGARMSESDVNGRLANAMGDKGEKLSGALLRMQTALGDAAAPAVESFAKTLVEHGDDIEAVMSAFGKLASFLVEHPLQAAFMALEAEIVKAVAGPAISSSISDALKTTIGGNAAIGLAVAAGITLALQAGMNAIDAAVKGDEEKERGAAVTNARAGQLAAKIEAGNASPAEVEEARRIQGKLGKVIENDKGNVGAGATDVLSNPRGAFVHLASGAGMPGGDEAAAQMRAELKEHNSTMRDLTAALRGIRDAKTLERGGKGGNPYEDAPHPNQTGGFNTPARGSPQ